LYLLIENIQICFCLLIAGVPFRARWFFDQDHAEGSIAQKIPALIGQRAFCLTASHRQTKKQSPLRSPRLCGEQENSLSYFRKSPRKIAQCEWSSGADGVPVGLDRGVLGVDPLDGAKLHLSRRRRKAPLRVNPEPLGYTRGLQLVERQVSAFMPGSRRIDFLSNQAYKTPIMIPRDGLITSIGQNCLKTRLISHYQGKMAS
jgi:hypothetical protein